MGFFTSEQLNQLQSVLKNLSKDQLLWLSGYVWGIINSDLSKNDINKSTIKNIKDSKPNPCTSNIKKYQVVTIISASQTGNARRIANHLYNELIELGIDVVLFSAGDYMYNRISSVKCLIFITSTHGEGEPPEEAIPLYRYLFSKTAPKLRNTNFSVLSLGDRSYENFAKAGRDFDKRFEELGGYRLCDRVDIDVDSEVDINKWKKQLISNIKLIKSDGTVLNKCSDFTQNVIASDFVKYSKENPLVAHLLNRQKITSCNSIKDVHHLEINIAGSNVSYQPGDALGVWYENDLQLITELLNITNLTGHEIVKSHGKSMSLKKALQKHYELTQNNLAVFQNIATISKDKILLDLLKNQKKINDFITQTPLIDMFRTISVKLTPQDLLKILRPIKPRFYSIASAQSEVGEEIHIAVSAVRYQVNGRLRSGGASSYLVDRISENDELRVFIESNDNFRLPDDSSVAIIMIGSGTGIAPFRSFMQQRLVDKAVGKNWLFFGNVSFINDFLYQTEWQRYVKLGLLNKVDTTWSRDQEHKVYIQDKLLKNSDEIWNWIQSGAYIYVCGDAKRMAYGVEQALITLVSKHGNMNLDESINFWNDLRIQHRYQRDIY